MVRRHTLALLTAILTVVVLFTVAVIIGLGGGSPTKLAVEPLPVATNVPIPLATSTSLPPATVPVATTTPKTAAPLPVAHPPTTPVPAPPTTQATVAPTPTTTAVRPHLAVASPSHSTASGNAGDFTLIGYRWNPCKVITVSSTGPDVSAAVSELAAITGLRLQVVSGSAQISVGIGAVAPGGEVGVTGWKASGGWLVQATVLISPDAAPYIATVLRHELGHAMGLGHASQPGQVMYPSVGPGSPTTYSAGDQAGLRAVGAAKGC